MAAFLGANVWLTNFSGGSTTTHSESILVIAMQKTISKDINIQSPPLLRVPRLRRMRAVEHRHGRACGAMLQYYSLVYCTKLLGRKE